MRHAAFVVFVCLCTLALTGPVSGWSLLDEVTVIDPGLSAEVVWELDDAKIYCASLPQNLDRLACIYRDPTEFWIGSDAASNRYGLIVADEPLGSFFDIYRRPAGTSFNNHVVRITKRVEPVFGEPIKLFTAGVWEIDVTQGWLLLHLRGECLTAACQAEGDTGEHLALIRINGPPPLIEIYQSYLSSGSVSFRLPEQPEGLENGERYDVYVGDLDGVADLSAAQPFSCDVAAGGAPGDRVEVDLAGSAPSPGQGLYYVTSVSQGTERRAGRRRIGGVLSGRDGNVLAPCAVP